MTQSNKTIKVFTGSEVTVAFLSEELENQGISSMIINDFNSGVMAGFSGGVSSAIDLYVENEDAEKAIQIINELLKETE